MSNITYFNILNQILWSKQIIGYNHIISLIFVTGMQHVYASITDDSVSNNQAFQLTAGSGSMELHGILCENG